MKPEPKIVDGVPLCVETCPLMGHLCCSVSSGIVMEDDLCEPAFLNIVAQVAEVKRLCQSHNNPGSNPGAHKLAGDVLRILEDSE